MGFNWKELDRYEEQQALEKKLRPRREDLLKKRKDPLSKEFMIATFAVFGSITFIMLYTAYTIVFHEAFKTVTFAESLALGIGAGILLALCRGKNRKADEETEEQPESRIEALMEDHTEELRQTTNHFS